MRMNKIAELFSAAKMLPAGRGAEGGFTLIELMVSMAILLISMLMTLQIVQEGMMAMYDTRIKSKVRECGRLAAEYFESLPGDSVFAMSKQSPKEYSFSGTGDTDMKNFVDVGDPSCKKLSDTTDPVGAKVKLKYVLCPGCIAYTPNTSPYTTCIYNISIRLKYGGVFFGGKDQKIDYAMKDYMSQREECDDPAGSDGCGTGGDPEVKRLCSF